MSLIFRWYANCSSGTRWNNFANLRKKCHVHTMGVVYCTWRLPCVLNSTTATTDHFVGALHSAILFPTLMFSEFVFRYLGVPLTFAAPDRAGGFSKNGRYRTWWCLSMWTGSLHFDYCPFSLLKYTNRAIKLAVVRVRWNTVHVAVGARHVKIFLELFCGWPVIRKIRKKIRPAKFKRYTVTEFTTLPWRLHSLVPQPHVPIRTYTYCKKLIPYSECICTQQLPIHSQLRT